MENQSRTCEILSALAKQEWKELENSDEPPEITPDLLRNWMPPLQNDDLLNILSSTDDKLSTLKVRLSNIPKKPEPDNWQMQALYRMTRCKIQHTIDVPTQMHYVEKNVDYSKHFNLEEGTILQVENTPVITNIDEIKPSIAAHYAMLAILNGWHSKDRPKISISESGTPTMENGTLTINLDLERDSIQYDHFRIIHSIRSLEDGVESIQDLWKIVNEKHKGEFLHPLRPIVREYLQQTSTKEITKEYDSKHPGAMLHQSLGCRQEVQLNIPESARLREFVTPESIKAIQLELIDTSIIPNVLPLDIATPLGIEFKTRTGAVSHVLRIFFEAIMSLEPKQTQANISYKLGDLIDYLYPDGIFNRTNQLPYIIHALDILHFYATVPFKQSNGNMGRWRPVVVRNALDTNAKNSDKIYLDVRMPPDATQGLLVQKQIMRMLGKKSARQFSAYLSACYLWDKYGTVNGKLIDPTRPIENRNSEGYLVDERGNELRGRNGKRMKNAYQSDAIYQLKRETNPSRDIYPIISNEDLIKACNIKTTSNTHRDLKRAKEYWTKLEEDNIVVIERFDREGWRIMPSDEHIKLYRGIQNSKKD